MNARRQFGTCAAVFTGLLLVYVGAYLGIYKNELGRKIFGNIYQARGAAHLLHRVSAHLFAPLRYLECRMEESRLKNRLAGKWASASGSHILIIHKNGGAILKGFDELGAPDSVSQWTMWDYDVSGDYGDPARPYMVISFPDLAVALELEPSETDRNGMQVWRAGYRGPGLVLQRPPLAQDRNEETLEHHRSQNGQPGNFGMP